MEMLHFKAPGLHFTLDSLAEPWGNVTRYIELGGDQYATRQIDAFDNGNELCYDRFHWRDDYGMLIGLRFSRKPKWKKFFHGLVFISAHEFEKVWRRAINSTLRKQQLDTSRKPKWGDSPHWLRGGSI